MTYSEVASCAQLNNKVDNSSKYNIWEFVDNNIIGNALK